MAQESSGSSPAPSQSPLEMDEEFRFLLCENCRQEVGCPKLLPCLHNVCTECLQETKPVNCCPICKAPHSQTDGTSVRDNMLFANLRAKLSVFEIIKSGQDLVCNNCKKEGAYWCSDCQEFMCPACYESHQRYLKRESHEARAVKDLKAESSQGFLTEFKNTAVMFCSNAEHKMQNLSIYCKACQLSMCCVCAVLDSRHNGHHCHIREEIQRRQQELLSVTTELKEKKTSYDRTCSNLQELVNNMVELRNKTRELIQQKVAEMLRLVQEKGERLLASVQEQHRRRVQDTEEKLHNVELVGQRMESCNQLVEKMQLYASDQEVMDMYPFIRESLEELKRKEPPMVETQIPVGNFADVETQLQAFYERVTKEKEPAPIPVRTTYNQESVGKAPVKRKSVQVGNSSLTPMKCIKIEPDDGKQEPPTGRGALEQPGTSSGDRPAGNGDGVREGEATEVVSKDWFPVLSSDSFGQVDQEQPGTSSGDRPAGDGDGVWNGGDTEIVHKEWFPISSSESSDADALICLNWGKEDSSSDDAESMGSVLQEDVNSESRQDEFWRDVFRPPRQLFSGPGPLVFFDLKVLPGTILHLVAIVDETNVFSVMVQPLISSPRGDVKGGLCEIGLGNFLRYLQSLRQPILVGYDLWSMDFPVLANALQATKKEEDFKAAVFGFLDALPLIKERIPGLPSYTLKSLVQEYLWGQLDDSQVIDCAKSVKDLCTVLDVNPGMDRRPVVTYSSLQSYGSLQPLLTRRLLSRSTVQSLALHGVCLSTLLSVYKKDPIRGLQKFSGYLNSRQTHGGGRVRRLSKARIYFFTPASASRASASAAAKSDVCLSH